MQVSKKRSKPIRPFHNMRAHANPFSCNRSSETPIAPQDMNWVVYYPAYEKQLTEQYIKVEFADVGCGFGGLTIALGEKFPNILTLGLEIRGKPCDYVRERILKLRESSAGKEYSYNNVAVMQTNAMKFLPNIFQKAQLTKIFFLFPDPHFKKIQLSTANYKPSSAGRICICPCNWSQIVYCYRCQRLV